MPSSTALNDVTSVCSCEQCPESLRVPQAPSLGPHVSTIAADHCPSEANNRAGLQLPKAQPMDPWPRTALAHPQKGTQCLDCFWCFWYLPHQVGTRPCHDGHGEPLMLTESFQEPPQPWETPAPMPRQGHTPTVAFCLPHLHVY